MKTHVNTFSAAAVLLFAIFLFSATMNTQAQIDVNKLKSKAKEQMGDKKKPNEEKPQNEVPVNNQGNNTSSGNTPAASLLNEITKEQKEIIASNKTVTDNNSSDYTGKEVSIPAYLTFTNDFSKKDANMLSFTAKDAIYAKINMDKAITELMPGANDGNLQYYRVELLARVNGSSDESNLKIREKAHFKLPYSNKDILLAVCPEKAFYESILDDYQKAGKSKADAYNDVLARNFSSRIASVFSYLQPGEYKVEIEFTVTAKLQSDKYFKIKNIRGVFMLTIDEKSSDIYSEKKNMLTALYSEYEEKGKNEENTAYLKEQENKLNNMSIEERNQYLDQQKSTTSGFSDNSYKINIKSNNSGQAVYIVVTDLRTLSEKIHSVQPNATIALELYKGQKYKISAYGQNSSKENAIKIADVDESQNGKTFQVK
jgi:hypothetical protein